MSEKDDRDDDLSSLGIRPPRRGWQNPVDEFRRSVEAAGGKVTQLPGTAPAPAKDLSREVGGMMAKGIAMQEEQARAQAEAFQKQIELAERGVLAAEKSADALVRIADALERRRGME